MSHRIVGQYNCVSTTFSETDVNQRVNKTKAITVLDETSGKKNPPENVRRKRNTGSTGDDMEVFIDLWEQPSSLVAFLFIF